MRLLSVNTLVEIYKLKNAGMRISDVARNLGIGASAASYAYRRLETLLPYKRPPKQTTSTYKEALWLIKQKQENQSEVPYKNIVIADPTSSNNFQPSGGTGGLKEYDTPEDRMAAAFNTFQDELAIFIDRKIEDRVGVVLEENKELKERLEEIENIKMSSNFIGYLRKKWIKNN